MLRSGRAGEPHAAGWATEGAEKGDSSLPGGPGAGGGALRATKARLLFCAQEVLSWITSTDG